MFGGGQLDITHYKRIDFFLLLLLPHLPSNDEHTLAHVVRVPAQGC